MILREVLVAAKEAELLGVHPPIWGEVGTDPGCRGVTTRSFWRLALTDRRREVAGSINTWVDDICLVSNLLAASIIPWVTLLGMLRVYA